MSIKNPVVEAADSMRDAWELKKSEIRNTGTYVEWSRTRWEQCAIRFVSDLMPGEQPATVLLVAKRLLEG